MSGNGLPFSSLTLTLKRPGLWFCRMLPQSGFSDILSLIQSDCAFCQECLHVAGNKIDAQGGKVIGQNYNLGSLAQRLGTLRNLKWADSGFAERTGRASSSAGPTVLQSSDEQWSCSHPPPRDLCLPQSALLPLVSHQASLICYLSGPHGPLNLRALSVPETQYRKWFYKHKVLWLK